MKNLQYTSINYCNPTGLQDLHAILDLQAANLPENISREESLSQGFVTVHHNLELLQAMNEAEPQVIAKVDEELVGYALVMLRAFRTRIPVLMPMFDLLDTLSYHGKAITDYNYYVMGQVCVAKTYRGQSIFDGLYHQQKDQLSGRYDFVVTEVAVRNARSLRAHYRVGFETLHRYKAPNEEHWEILLWDWK